MNTENDYYPICSRNESLNSIRRNESLILLGGMSIFNPIRRNESFNPIRRNESLILLGGMSHLILSGGMSHLILSGGMSHLSY